ncbi:MAG TPA: sensor domain-containing diguanylate cyclase [Nitrospiria bacterium]|jgi:diguanylate cyclase (GGDEF)-like protein
MEPASLISTNPLLNMGALLLVGALAFFIGIFLGRIGISQKILKITEEKKKSDKKSAEESNFRRTLQNQITQLDEKNRDYLKLFVTLPEAVKRLCSNLTIEEVTSSIVRLTFVLMNAGEIALFLFRPDEKRLQLSLAYGLDKEKYWGLSYALGEGKIGITGEAKIVLTSDDFKYNPEVSGKIPKDGNPLVVDFCAPIRFKGRLHGVLSVGKIKSPDQNHRTFLAMIADLAAISLDNVQRLDDVQLTARVDSLTQLYNRRYFEERLMEEAQKCGNYNFECSIFMFDVDHFKKYNDQNGHQAGDELLQKMARLVRKNTRGTDILARYGGEEFIVLLSNQGRERAIKYAENTCKLIETHIFPNLEKQPLGFVSISGGVASFPKDGRTLNEIIQKADKALYEAKNAGRNRVVGFGETP